MSFKHYLFISAVSVLILGCAGEKEAFNQPIEPQIKARGGCLSQFGSEVRRFFDGKMSQPEVVAFWTCTADAVKEYRRLTSGEHRPDAYTPEALGRFFREYLSVSLDNDLIASLMEIKRVFLSGDSEHLTWEELDRLLRFVGELQAFSLDIHPHVQVLFGRENSPDVQRVEEANLAFERAMERIGLWLQAQNQRYAFSDLRQLLARLRLSLGAESTQGEFLQKLEHGIPVLKPAKQILIYGSQEHIDGHEWLPLCRVIARSMKAYVHGFYAFQPGYDAALNSDHLPQSLQIVTDILDEAINRRWHRQIPLREFHQVIEKAEAAGWLPGGYSAQAVSGLVNWLMARPFGLGEMNDKLAKKHLNVIRARMDRWRLLLQDPFAVPEYRATVEASVPLVWDSNGRIHFNLDGQKSWSEEGRRRLIWSFVILDWVREAYVGQRPALNESEVTIVATEVLPVFHAFGWFSKTEVTIGKRLLREADVFTHASNGNLQLDLPEAVRYLSFVMSAYQSASLWLEAISSWCPTRAAECVRASALQKGVSALDPLPQLAERVRSAPPEQFAAYMKHAEETILGRVQAEPFTTSELLQVWMIFQYVETFLRRYDQNADQLIQLPESLVAFEVYGPTLTKLLSASGLPREEIVAFFTFMMRYGDTPFTLFGGQVLYNHWKWHRNEWDFNADRSVLMSILNQLSKF
jgi:hypothetical protein